MVGWRILDLLFSADISQVIVSEIVPPVRVRNDHLGTSRDPPMTMLNAYIGTGTTAMLGSFVRRCPEQAMELVREGECIRRSHDAVEIVDLMQFHREIPRWISIFSNGWRG